jgi:hypothetical protein
VDKPSSNYEVTVKEGANTLISAYNISQHYYDGGLCGIFAQNGDGTDEYRKVDDVSMKVWISSQWTTVWSSAFYLYSEVTLTYDDAGNTEYDGPYKYTYDAWNRLKDTSTWQNATMMQRDYDALGRLIVAKTYADGGVDRTDKYYYNINRQQIIEVRSEVKPPTHADRRRYRVLPHRPSPKRKRRAQSLRGR